MEIINVSYRGLSVSYNGGTYCIGMLFRTCHYSPFSDCPRDQVGVASKLNRGLFGGHGISGV